MKVSHWGRWVAALCVTALLMLHLTGMLEIWWNQARYPLHYQDTVRVMAEDFGVDPFLVTAVIRAESGFRQRAVSSSGARGLMQIMPDTGRWAATAMGWEGIEAEELFDPETNIAIGTWYLAHLEQEFGANPVAVLAAYNAGRGNVWSWLQAREKGATALEIDDIPFPETRAYVERVLEYRQAYYGLYREEWPDAGKKLAGESRSSGLAPNATDNASKE